MATSQGLAYFKGAQRLHVGHFSHMAGHTAWHDHDFSEISVILDGTGWYHSPGHRHRLSRGQVFWVRPGVQHFYQVEKSHRVINILVGDEFLKKIVQWGQGPSAPRGPVVAFLEGFLKSRAEGAWLLETADFMPTVRDMEDLEATLEDDLEASVEHGFLTLLGLCRRLKKARELGPRDLEPEGREKVERVRSLVVAGLTERFSLDGLASRVGWGGATLSRQFRKHTGYTLFGFIATQRVARACHLLRETENPIVDIALDVGFSNLSFFNRVFLRECGMTPGTYRKKGRGAGS